MSIIKGITQLNQGDCLNCSVLSANASNLKAELEDANAKLYTLAEMVKKLMIELDKYDLKLKPSSQD